MPWWVIPVDKSGKSGILGPYVEARAQEVKDGLDCPAGLEFTSTSNKAEAKRVIRGRHIEVEGFSKGNRNFYRKVGKGGS